MLRGWLLHTWLPHQTGLCLLPVLRLTLRREIYWCPWPTRELRKIRLRVPFLQCMMQIRVFRLVVKQGESPVSCKIFTLSDSPHSPAQGAVFSLLALKLVSMSHYAFLQLLKHVSLFRYSLTNRTIIVPPSSTSKSSANKSSSNAGAIAGGAIGGFAFLAALVAGSLLFRRWRKRRTQGKELIDMTASYDAHLQQHDPIDLNTYSTHQLAPIVTQPYRRPQTYSDVGSMPNPWGGSEVGSSSQNLVVRSDSQYQQESSRSYPVSIAPPSTYPSSADDTTEQLRSEVETLRREMQNIRAQRTVMYVNEVDETPPPEYIPSEVASSSSPTNSTPSIQPRPRKSWS